MHADGNKVEKVLKQHKYFKVMASSALPQSMRCLWSCKPQQILVFQLQWARGAPVMIAAQRIVVMRINMFRIHHEIPSGIKAFTMWLSLLCMRSKASLAAPAGSHA